LLRLDIPDGSRRARIRDRINEQYLEFIFHLPPALRETGYSLSTYTGKPSSKRLDRILDLNPLVVAAPFLFWGAFPLDDERLIQFATAGCYLGASYVILDHISDDQQNHPDLARDLQDALYEKAMLIFRDQFDPSSKIWNRVVPLWKELHDSLEAERRYQTSHLLVSRKTFQSIATAKTVPLIITVSALALASGRSYFCESVESSLRKVGPAVQLWHDVGDWLKDFADRRITYFISEVIKVIALESDREVEDVLREFLKDHGWRIKRDFLVIVSQKELLATYWSEAEEYFKEALLYTRRPELKMWNRYLEQWIAELQTYILSVTDPRDPRAKPLTLLQSLERIADSRKKT